VDGVAHTGLPVKSELKSILFNWSWIFELILSKQLYSAFEIEPFPIKFAFILFVDVIKSCFVVVNDVIFPSAVSNLVVWAGSVIVSIVVTLSNKFEKFRWKYFLWNKFCLFKINFLKTNNL
jgi:hypothetical protein